MKNRNRLTTAILAMILVLASGLATAGHDGFDLPRQMKSLLPATADLVLAVSSLEELDNLWLDLLPENPDQTIPSVSDLLLGLDSEWVQHLDPEKPLLLVVNLQSPMGGSPYFLTGLVALKDKNLDLASVPGLEKFNFIQKDRYLAVSTNPTFEPATERPDWFDNLDAGLVSATVDLASIIETYRFLIEMGMTQMENQATQEDNPTVSTEDTQAIIKMVHALLNSAVGIDFTLTRNGETVAKDFVFRTKPGSELSPAPQPSFAAALELTRFLPGGENLLSVSAIDPSKQMALFQDFHLASLHSTTDDMEPETAKRVLDWYTNYLAAMRLTFVPSATTLRFEKNNSSFQTIFQSNDPAADWTRLVDLAQGLTGLGLGLDLLPLDTQSFKGHEIQAWTLEWNEGELEGLLADEEAQLPGNPLLSSKMVTALRFLPGKIYLSHHDDYLLYCGGPDSGLMEDLIQRVAKGKGKIDPRLKKVDSQRGGHVQLASTGDLNILIALIAELLEEMGEDKEVPWLTDQPLPFLETMEIDGPDYRVHFEMEEPALRTLLKAALDWEQE